MFVLQHFTKG